jgi:two-component system response regulator RpfG
MNVLIIDDQASSRMVIRRILERMDLDIALHEFCAAEDALRWCETSRADLIMVDYSMPGMDGIGFTRRFKERECHVGVPVMMITVAEQTSLRQIAAESGVLDFIVKPFLPRLLQARCTNLLTMRQAQMTAEPRSNTSSGQFRELGKRVMDAVAVGPTRHDQSAHFKDLGRRVMNALRELKG